ncbi:transmembrane protein 243-like [Watersipora subatra]|uniref:transmembrane protein 243-like n=1 Tax=Watersipora subatra TaxID=2589382 RepID=UPI00355C120D
MSKMSADHLGDSNRSQDQYGAIDRPLFGETSQRDRLVNLVVGCVTGVLVLITLISAFVFPTDEPVNGMNVYFALCILLILLSHIILIYWYRQGDLDPKFRNMVYYNAFTLVLLCICANLYIHIVDDKKTKT